MTDEEQDREIGRERERATDRKKNTTYAFAL